MILNCVVEIIPNSSFRWIYSSDSKQFKKREFNHIWMDDKAFDGIYGWVEGYGTPPKNHMDVIVLTSKTLELGDVVSGKLVGAFKSYNGDHKLICIDTERIEDDLFQLKNNEKNILFRTYEGKYDGDAWLGKEGALSILKAHDPNNKIRMYK